MKEPNTIEIDCHLVREKVLEGILRMLPIASQERLADFLTKVLPACQVQMKISYPTHMYLFHLRKINSVNVNQIFFSANLSKIYTKKNFGLRLPNFFKVKKIYGGWDKLLSIQIASPAHT
jgi:hypothetical protein